MNLAIFEPDIPQSLTIGSTTRKIEKEEKYCCLQKENLVTMILSLRVMII